MTKLELIDLIRELLPTQPHRMTVEKVASIVYLDYLKALSAKNPNGLSQYRKPYTVTTADGLIPVPYLAGSILIPTDDLMYVPVTEEEAQYLAVIDDIDTTAYYFVKGNKLTFVGLPDGITQVEISVVPSLEAYDDNENIEVSTEQLGMILQLIRPTPEKQVNDRNDNNL